MHTWSFSPDSKLIRFYKWCWKAEAQDLNFCKLFWGILFSPLAILLRYPVKFVVYLIDRNTEPSCLDLDPNVEDGWAEYYAAAEAWKARKAERSNRVMRRVLRSIGNFFQKYGSKIFIAVIAFYVIFLTVEYILVVIHNPWNALLILLIPAGFLLAWLTVKAAENTRLKKMGHFISDGYHSTKDKTCPIIVIEDERKAAQHG